MQVRVLSSAPFFYDSVAQLDSEQLPSKHQVAGSSPAGITIVILPLYQRTLRTCWHVIGSYVGSNPIEGTTFL